MRTPRLGLIGVLFLLACGDDSSSAATGTPLTAVTAVEYDRLCDRVLSTMDLGAWIECTPLASCQSCLNELLNIDDRETCQDRIGTPARYKATACPWTVAQLDACFDEREALMDTIPCERPFREADGSHCLNEFWDACVEHRPDMKEPKPPPSPTGCDDTCVSASDNECDDGGQGSITDGCGLGTDCSDCGRR